MMRALSLLMVDCVLATRADSCALAKANRTIEDKRPRMGMTTRSSTRVKARRGQFSVQNAECKVAGDDGVDDPAAREQLTARRKRLRILHSALFILHFAFATTASHLPARLR